ncbi:MAG: adenylate/guanylate cyclase domain-containing protein [Leptolyngbyaceae cyanobacterium bins.59]|nr:adenylate/guanylate cyclase domain-containing protein [Leptolyngbyaceae cyanobacterium bins.59]
MTQSHPHATEQAIVGTNSRVSSRKQQVHLLKILASYNARLSRRLALSVFTSFMVIEGIVFIPSIQNEVKRLENQVKEVTSAKIEWLVETDPNATPEEMLNHIRTLQNKSMMQDLVGAVLYRDSDGQELGRLGEVPQLTYARIKQQQVRQHWFKLDRRFDTAWVSQDLRQDYLLVIRHDAFSIQGQLYAYALRIFGIVVLISIVITGATMVVVQSLVIVPILKLRDQLMAASEALQQDQTDPQSQLMVIDRRDELGDVMTAFNDSFLRNYEEMARRKKAEGEAQTEREKAESLLLNILPEPIAEELKQGRRNISDGFAAVSVLFADIVGFTTLSTLISVDDLVAMLNRIFSAFDELSDRHGLEKIKTIGDNYMVAGGLPIPREDHAAAIADMALEMQEVITMPEFHIADMEPLRLRIGINSGPVIAGVIGNKKFIYDLWGDAVNTASRMESSSLPGCIQVTESTYQILKDTHHFEKRGTLPIKGKGEMVTYWLKGRKI